MSRDKISRAVRWILLAGIRFYQAVWSPIMPGACKFYPSCSRYAAEAITVHGARRGLALALNRLWRCRPFTRGGVDPVPAPDSVPDAYSHAHPHAHPMGRLQP